MINESAISVNNISFSYEKKRIYDDLSVDFPLNKISFLMGVNGCGKTTLLKIICNFLIVEHGDIRVLGKSLSEYNSKSLSRAIAYVPQIINLNNDFLVKDYLAMGRSPYLEFGSSPSKEDFLKVEEYAKVFDILDLLDTNFSSLSGGQKQIVAITRAMIQETPIIIMDEPMSALDMGKQADLLSLLLEMQKKGKTIMLTSHNPNHALAIKDFCNVCLIHNHNILGQGECSSVLTKENVSIMFGNKVSLDENNSNLKFTL